MFDYNKEDEEYDAHVNDTQITEQEKDSNLDKNFSLDLDMEGDDDIWVNNYDHYDYFEAENKLLLSLPELVRPVEDHPIILIKFPHKKCFWIGHKLKFEGEYPKFYRCNGKDCYACKGEARLIDWQVEFFLNMSTRQIVYLAFEQVIKPGTLGGELRAALAGGFPAVISIQKDGKFKYDCKRITPKVDMNLGTEKIRDFLKLLKAGKVDFDSIVPQISNEDILHADGVSDYLKILGITE